MREGVCMTSYTNIMCGCRRSLRMEISRSTRCLASMLDSSIAFRMIFTATGSLCCRWLPSLTFPAVPLPRVCPNR